MPSNVVGQSKKKNITYSFLFIGAAVFHKVKKQSRAVSQTPKCFTLTSRICVSDGENIGRVTTLLGKRIMRKHWTCDNPSLAIFKNAGPSLPLGRTLV